MARRTQCKNNLHQIGLALHNDHDVARQFPLGSVNNDATWGFGSTPNTFRCRGRCETWKATRITLTLPYIVQAPLYNQYNFNGDALSDARNQPVVRTVISMLRCPSDTGHNPEFTPNGTFQNVAFFSKGNYAGIGAVDDIWSESDFVSRPTGSNSNRTFINAIGQWGSSLSDYLDGTSNTCIAAEVLTNPRPTDSRGGWGHPAGCIIGFNSDAPRYGDQTKRPNANALDNRWRDEPPYCDSPGNDPPLRCSDGGNSSTGANWTMRSRHVGGVPILLGDGSARFLSENIDVRTYADLMSTNDGNTLGQF